MLPAEKLPLEVPNKTETIICDADLVVFDCDGVLIDSWDAYQAFFARLQARFGLPPLNEDQKRQVFMCSMEEAVRRFFPKRAHEDALRLVKSLSWDELAEQVVLEPGARRVLRGLKRAGKRIALNTNAQSGIRYVLERFGMLEYFDLVITADDVAAPKPDPQGASIILKALDTPAPRTVFIGDSKADQLTAARLQMPFWAYRNDSLPAHRHLNSFFQVLVIKGASSQNHFDKCFGQRGNGYGSHHVFEPTRDVKPCPVVKRPR